MFDDYDGCGGCDDYPMTPREGRFISFLLALAVTCGFMWVQLRMLRSHDGTSWRRAEAQTLGKEIVQSNGEPRFYTPTARYVYVVDGKTYERYARIGLFLDKGKAEEVVNDLANEYMLQGSLTVYYDVDKPSESVMSTLLPATNTVVMHVILIALSVIPLLIACLLTELIDWRGIGKIGLFWLIGWILSYWMGRLFGWKAWRTFWVVWICVLVGSIFGFYRRTTLVDYTNIHAVRPRKPSPRIRRHSVPDDESDGR